MRGLNWLLIAALFIVAACGFTSRAEAEPICYQMAVSAVPIQHAVDVQFTYTPACDSINVRWAAPGGKWQQDNLTPDSNSSTTCDKNWDCTFNLTRADHANADKPYLIMAQECFTRILASSKCGPWTETHYLPYGPDTCIDGTVWREASPSDHVCAPVKSRDDARADNAAAGSRIAKAGSNICKVPFVWRAAFPGDAVCTTVDIRTRTAQENANENHNWARTY